MTRVPQIGVLADGKRLHLQDGPIDLIVEARGSEADLRAAYDAAVASCVVLVMPTLPYTAREIPPPLNDGSPERFTGRVTCSYSRSEKLLTYA